ncbi:MAG: hypothetical protein A2275_14895 [Bacteroidetes bacterium RIFOXYA12_FULL_35_11]|nr:MAG: hypothetical protein A2X01_10040 [Bacteroidetes bacterium GWF2_35_48]OFY73295.1 MAG: hypothetical protein A2275_14895 [Bacteroidetes bacterium RIFOXYA12_FULL_35_11]OFY97984.1 MAG: hypothetical protein A2491_19065 [Bacteroidetes bacterium RIFOXYC12_FULL_35_7]HBX52368.1 hypothetical protein [Bacteroidales bacterium]
MKLLLLLLFYILIFFSARAQTVSDADGNTYNTVVIGKQIWMKENLRTTKFADGTPMENILEPTNQGGYCDYNNNPDNSNLYGRLYNWFSITKKIGICPAGFHVPSDSEWNILAKFLDNSVDTTLIDFSGKLIGGIMKEKGNLSWKKTNKKVTNSSGFSALPGGWRTNDGEYKSIGISGSWITSTEEDISYVFIRALDADKIQIGRLTDSSISMHSVRCVKENK